MKKIIIILILAIVLSGCANGERYEFTGESENWDIIYIVDISNDNDQETTGTIEYIGDEPIPKTIDYELGTKLMTLGGTGKQLNEGKTSIGNDRCEGCAVIQEDAEIEVEIMWNGQTENLTLKNDK